MGFVIPAIIGAGAALLGGSLNRAQQRQQFNTQLDQSREFAQYGVRWKVADAKAAGIHPLAALGAQTGSFSPQYVGSSDYGVSEAGQNISRAMMAASTSTERKIANEKLKQEELKTKMMTHDWYKIRGLNNPAFPGGESTTGIVGQESPVLYQEPQNMLSQSHGLQKGAGPGVAYSDLPGGVKIEAPSPRLEEALENDLTAWGQYQWNKLARSGKIKYYYLRPGAKGAGAHRAMLRKLRPKSPEPGWEYRVDPTSVAPKWILRKIGKSGSRLYAIGSIRKKEQVGGRTYSSREWGSMMFHGH